MKEKHISLCLSDNQPVYDNIITMVKNWRLTFDIVSQVTITTMVSVILPKSCQVGLSHSLLSLGGQ